MAPSFPAEAHLLVRRSPGPDVEPFAVCSGFEGSLGPDQCGSPWSGRLFFGEEGGASVAYPPQFSTYGYILWFDGERGQLCREFGDETGDLNRCVRRDVRCASSGEVVVTEGGASVVAIFPGGGQVEAAWLFWGASDAGSASD